MSDKGSWALLGVIALAGPLAFLLWLVGSERLRLVMLVTVLGILIIGAIAASALPIRAWRKRDLTGETHYVHDGTRTVVKERILDGRQALSPEVKLLQLPQMGGGAVFPELLRAAYLAGGRERLMAGAAAAGAAAAGAMEVEDEAFEFDQAEAGWTGEIRG